jgi:hypothetical protein
MGEQRWKRIERAVAKRLGGQRQPITGRRGPDVLHPWLAIETKTRKRLPHWLTQAIEQAEAVATGDQLPVVILHEAGTRLSQALVLMRLADFEEWHGSIRQRATADTQ